MRASLLAVAVLLSIAACKGKARRVEEPAPAAAPSAPAVETDPARETTPDRVQREVEEIGQQHEKDVDKALDVQ